MRSERVRILAHVDWFRPSGMRCSHEQHAAETRLSPSALRLCEARWVALRTLMYAVDAFGEAAGHLAAHLLTRELHGPDF